MIQQPTQDRDCSLPEHVQVDASNGAITVSISQISYNIFLMEKTAHHLSGTKFRKNAEKLSRKLFSKDVLSCFAKLARTLDITISSFDAPLDEKLAKAIRYKYDIDVMSLVDTPLRPIAEAIANAPRKIGNVTFERRKP